MNEKREDRIYWSLETPYGPIEYEANPFYVRLRDLDRKEWFLDYGRFNNPHDAADYMDGLPEPSEAFKQEMSVFSFL